MESLKNCMLPLTHSQNSNLALESPNFFVMQSEAKISISIYSLTNSSIKSFAYFDQVVHPPKILE